MSKDLKQTIKVEEIKMNRIKLVMEYLGTNFSGFQVQPNKRTVQGEVESALQTILGTPVKIYASGRTDAGVHSLGQVAHFDTEKEVDCGFLLHKLNELTASDITILSVEPVSLDFDSRFSVKRKTYEYRFYLSRFDRAIMIGRALRVNDNINVARMKEATKYLVGTYDFSSFVARKSGKTDFVRTIYSADIVEGDDGLYKFVITGNGFLYNMVRIIMGTLLDVGAGRKEPGDILNIINGKSRALAGKTVPPVGLYMKRVEYLL